MSTNKSFQIFSSFEEENRAEAKRRAAMSPEERCQEMAILQVRRWGKRWTSTPIEKIATWEKVSW